jgi:ABC-type nitrate/sulfonate/bicarbonate transport system substrate-binding protein
MKIFKLLVAIISFGFVATEASAQITKITTSYVSDSAAVLPLWIAKDTGIFARNGLDVQAVRVHASVGVMALLSGELQFVLARDRWWSKARCAAPTQCTLPAACRPWILRW